MVPLLARLNPPPPLHPRPSSLSAITFSYYTGPSGRSSESAAFCCALHASTPRGARFGRTVACHRCFLWFAALHACVLKSVYMFGQCAWCLSSFNAQHFPSAGPQPPNLASFSCRRRSLNCCIDIRRILDAGSGLCPPNDLAAPCREFTGNRLAAPTRSFPPILFPPHLPPPNAKAFNAALPRPREVLLGGGPKELRLSPRCSLSRIHFRAQIAVPSCSRLGRHAASAC